MASFWESGMLFIVLGAYIALFSSFNGVVFDNVGGDLKETIKNNLNLFFWICASIVLVLGGLSVFFIRQNPNALNPYLIIITHISLLLSLTSISFSTMTTQSR
jgi:hypothetical protein